MSSINIIQSAKLFVQSASKIKVCHRISSTKFRFVNTVTSQGSIAPVVAKDFLLQNIKFATDCQKVMEIVGSHHSIMNSKHVVQALKTLFELQKLESSNESKKKILESKEFLLLCKSLKSQSRTLDTNETVEALKCVCYIGLPSESAIVQILFQLLRHQINDLNLHQIVFLEYILSKFETCTLIEALKIALPIVFEAQLSVKLERRNVSQLAEMLQYAVRNNLSISACTLLIDCLVEIYHDIDPKSAIKIAWSLGDVDRSFNSVPFLFRQTLNVMSDNIDDYSFDEIEVTLRRILKNQSKNTSTFYHEEFLESCARYVVKYNCSIEKASSILQKLTKVGHTNINLMDYIAQCIVNNPMILDQSKKYTLIGIIHGFSHSDYKPLQWECIQRHILATKVLTQGLLEHFSLKTVLELATLDCFHIPLLESVFREDFLQKELKVGNLLPTLQVLNLYQAVITLFPVYRGPFPSDDIIQSASALNGNHVEVFPLKAALEQAFGGSIYVLTKCYTKMGHFIDHAIIMRKGGFPIAVHSNEPVSTNILIEDLHVPEDSQIILILGFQQSCYMTNSKRLKGLYSMICRSLEALGHSVVPISLPDWCDAPDREKIPYLMQNIRSKCDTVNHEIGLSL